MNYVSVLEELMKNMKETIKLYLETLTNEEKKDVLKQRIVAHKVKVVV